MTNIEQTEVRTRSVPTAAALICMGHEIVRVIHRDHGGALLLFAPEARPALDRFMATKMHVDGLIEEADMLR